MMQQHELDIFNFLLTKMFDNSTQHFNLLYVSCVLDEAFSYKNIAGVDPKTGRVTAQQAQVVMMVRNTCQRLLDMVPFAHEFGRGMFINVIINDVLGKIVGLFNTSTSEVNRTPYGQGLSRSDIVPSEVMTLGQYKENIIRACYDAMAVIGIKHRPNQQTTNSLFGFPLLKSDRSTAKELLFEESMSDLNELARDIRSSRAVSSLNTDVQRVFPGGGKTGEASQQPIIDLNEEDVKALFNGMNYYAFVLGHEPWLYTFIYGPDLKEHMINSRAEKDLENMKLTYGDDFAAKVESSRSKGDAGLFLSQILDDSQRFSMSDSIEPLTDQSVQRYADSRIAKQLREAEEASRNLTA